MGHVYQILGGILAFAGGGWVIYLLAERFDVQPTAISPASMAMALGAVFFGLLLIGLGEICKSLAEIAANTRKPV